MNEITPVECYGTLAFTAHRQTLCNFLISWQNGSVCDRFLSVLGLNSVR
jgi:hypothetical protein